MTRGNVTVWIGRLEVARAWPGPPVTLHVGFKSDPAGGEVLLARIPLDRGRPIRASDDQFEPAAIRPVSGLAANVGLVGAEEPHHEIAYRLDARRTLGRRGESPTRIRRRGTMENIRAMETVR